MPTISFDITTPQASRIATAVGSELNLGRDATPAEVRSMTINLLKNMVLARERFNAISSAQAAVPPSTPLDIP